MGDFQRFWCELILVLDPRNSLVAVVVVGENQSLPFHGQFHRNLTTLNKTKHAHAHIHIHPKRRRQRNNNISQSTDTRTRDDTNTIIVFNKIDLIDSHIM
jgi:hypothetical protein